MPQPSAPTGQIVNGEAMDFDDGEKGANKAKSKVAF